MILTIDLRKTLCRAAEAAILAIRRELGPVDEVIAGTAGALATPAPVVEARVWCCVIATRAGSDPHRL